MESLDRRAMIFLAVAVGAVAALLVAVYALGGDSRTDDPEPSDATHLTPMPLPEGVSDTPGDLGAVDIADPSSVAATFALVIGNFDPDLGTEGIIDAVRPYVTEPYLGSLDELLHEPDAEVDAWVADGVTIRSELLSIGDPQITTDAAGAVTTASVQVRVLRTASGTEPASFEVSLAITLVAGPDGSWLVSDSN